MYEKLVTQKRTEITLPIFNKVKLLFNYRWIQPTDWKSKESGL